MDNTVDKEGVISTKKKKKFVYLDKYELQVEVFESHMKKINARVNELYIGLVILSVVCAGLLFVINNLK
jgi:hypothetical protein